MGIGTTPDKPPCQASGVNMFGFCRYVYMLQSINRPERYYVGMAADLVDLQREPALRSSVQDSGGPPRRIA
jgi:hypothetical protein